ncbi:MAG: ribonuclease P protein component [Candidatus Saccharibacteria bacterium]|nr:ribonuclease P protein component [Candidatus Saccharibacteria bacterium]
MLAKKYRFHSRGGVNFTYKHGKTIRKSQIALVHNDNSRGFQRFAVVISKKVIKSAVGRNRVRRRVYEAIRAELPEYKAKKDCIFVIYSKDVKDMPFPELQNIIHNLLSLSQK